MRTAAERQARMAAYGGALVIALALGYFVAGNPLQVTDMLGNLFQVQKASLWEMSVGQLRSTGYLRPALWAQIDITFDLARGHYHAMYKGIHVAQVVCAALLFVSLLRVRTMWDASGAVFGMAMLFGARTIGGALYEAFPINNFMTIVLCAMATAWLVLAPRPSWWRDVAATALFLLAALTMEQGLVVWVVIAAGWLAGGRGVSGKGVLVASATLLAYFALRFGPLGVGAPDLLERSSGFGFGGMEADELARRFGEWPYPFYAYNVLSQLMAVLFAEPRSGVFSFTRDLLRGGALPYQYLAVLASTGATSMIGWFLVTRRGAWRSALSLEAARERLTHGDRLVLTFIAVLAANAVISYPYTKDAIMSPAGAFHALAGAVAFGAALEHLCRRQAEAAGSGIFARALLPVALTAGLFVISAAWTTRLVGMHYALREHAWVVRNDWTRVFGVDAPIDFSTDPEAAALTRQLQREIIARRVPPSFFAQPNAYRYLEIPW